MSNPRCIRTIQVFICSLMTLGSLYVSAAPQRAQDFEVVGQGMVRIQYSNNNYTTFGAVQNIMFRKGAEVAFNNGYDYFELVNKVATSKYISSNFSSDNRGDIVLVKNKDGKIYKEADNSQVSISFPRYTFSAVVKLHKEGASSEQQEIYHVSDVLRGIVALATPFKKVKVSEFMAIARGDLAAPAPSPANMANASPATATPEAAVAQAPEQKSAQQWNEESYQSIQAQDWDDAIKTASMAMETDQSFDKPYINRATAYIQIGQLDKAEADIDQLLQLSPEHADGLNIKGYLLQQNGDKVAAADYYDRACKLELKLACSNFQEVASAKQAPKKLDVDELLNLAQQAFSQQRWNDVIKLSTLVLDQNPSNDIAYSNRAGALAEQGYLQDALKDINNALYANPKNAIPYNNRAYIYELMGNTVSALSDYKTSCNMGVEPSCTKSTELSASTAAATN